MKETKDQRKNYCGQRGTNEDQSFVKGKGRATKLFEEGKRTEERENKKRGGGKRREEACRRGKKICRPQFWGEKKKNNDAQMYR